MLVVILGGLLIVIGFVILVRPGNLPGSTFNQMDPYAELAYPPPRNHSEEESRRRTVVRVLVGLGVMVIGGLCIGFAV